MDPGEILQLKSFTQQASLVLYCTNGHGNLCGLIPVQSTEMLLGAYHNDSRNTIITLQSKIQHKPKGLLDSYTACKTVFKKQSQVVFHLEEPGESTQTWETTSLSALLRFSFLQFYDFKELKSCIYLLI